MLGWFKRRLVFEHKKLLVLNGKVALDSELKVRLSFLGLYDFHDRLEEIRRTTVRMLKMGVPESGLDHDSAALGLDLNKELMRLFELGYERPVRDFESTYIPIGGWKHYFERMGDSWNCLE